MEIVIIPAWRRPEFLEATLRRIWFADEGNQQYWICLDRRHDRHVAQVATRFAQKLGHQRVSIIRRNHPYRGNSYNVLRSYRDAVKREPSLIHLIEEDIFISTDYFQYHRAAHNLVPDAFAVSGARNQNIEGNPDPQSGAVYLNGHYQSLAVSFRPEKLKPVLEHDCSSYYRNSVLYCRKKFPHTKINPNNAEQDGLIHRVMESLNAHMVYPTVPVAYHAGFIGYHRDGEPVLVPGQSITQAADKLLSMDSAELNWRAHSYPDHHTVDMHASHEPPSHVVTWPVLS